MRRRSIPVMLAVLAAALVCGNGAAQTRYNYGSGGFAGEAGFLVFLEAGLANPRNTDNIVAAAGPNVVIPEWDDEFAGRIGFGYQLGDGSKLTISFWSFDAEQDAAGVGSFEFPIGPTDGFSFDVTTEVQAHTIDASWSFPQQVDQSFGMEWTVGLRYAGFEETTGGTYGTTGGPAVVSKSNQGDMIGARVAGRATYRRGPFSGSAGVGLSLLDGELDTDASLTPQPAGTSPLTLTDDSRSGSILEVDVRGAWHNAADDVSVWIGWEAQIWDRIAADQARNLPNSEVIARARDSVTFSWLKAGVSYKF